MCFIGANLWPEHCSGRFQWRSYTRSSSNTTSPALPVRSRDKLRRHVKQDGSGIEQRRTPFLFHDWDLAERLFSKVVHALLVCVSSRRTGYGHPTSLESIARSDHGRCLAQMGEPT